jgi:hypothetical protein
MSSSANFSNDALTTLGGPFTDVAFRLHQLELMQQIASLKKEREVFEQEMLAQGFDPELCLSAFQGLSQDEQHDLNVELGLAAPQAPLATLSRLPRRRSFL